MNIFDDIRLYLPKYLSEESTKLLLKNLGNFPDNISNSLYSNSMTDSHVIFQGDGLRSFSIINLPDEKIGKAPVIILSNTCDIDLSNRRDFSAQISYIPIFSLEKYEKRLLEIKDSSFVRQHINSLKKQLITQIFYLPIGGGLSYEGIVFLDRINHCNNKSISRENLQNDRLFMLSNYGFYLFLTKLSIHFLRLQEGKDRT